MRNTLENNVRYKQPCTKGKGYQDAFVRKGSTHFCEGEINEIYRAYSFPFLMNACMPILHRNFAG